MNNLPFPVQKLQGKAVIRLILFATKEQINFQGMFATNPAELHCCALT